MGNIAKKYSTVTTCPAVSPNKFRATTVMSAPGLRDAATKRDRPRWARKVIGPMIKVAMINGHTPPAPALIGRNRIPAPTAVPNSEIAQLFSNIRLLRNVGSSRPSARSLPTVAWSGSVGSCDISALHFLRAAGDHGSLFKVFYGTQSCPRRGSQYVAQLRQLGNYRRSCILSLNSWGLVSRCRSQMQVSLGIAEVALARGT